MILLQEPVNETRHAAAGWTLEIAKFFQRDRSVRVTANMNRFGCAFARHVFVCGNRQKMRPFGPIQHRSAPECGQCDCPYNDKSQIALHEKRRERAKLQCMRKFVKCW